MRRLFSFSVEMKFCVSECRRNDADISAPNNRKFSDAVSVAAFSEQASEGIQQFTMLAARC
jgi:hypothetical protein